MDEASDKIELALCINCTTSGETIEQITKVAWLSERDKYGLIKQGLGISTHGHNDQQRHDTSDCGVKSFINLGKLITSCCILYATVVLTMMPGTSALYLFLSVVAVTLALLIVWYSWN